MATKIETSIIQRVLSDTLKLSMEEMASVLEKMRSLADEEKKEEAEDNETQKVKKEAYFLIDKRSVKDENLYGFFIKAPTESSEDAVKDLISSAAFDFNDKQKRASKRVNNIFDALANIPSKFFKKYNVSLIEKDLKNAFVMSSEFGNRVSEDNRIDEDKEKDAEASFSGDDEEKA